MQSNVKDLLPLYNRLLLLQCLQISLVPSDSSPREPLWLENQKDITLLNASALLPPSFLFLLRTRFEHPKQHLDSLFQFTVQFLEQIDVKQERKTG